MEGVQRFLINENNHLRLATVVDAPIKPIEDAVVNKGIPHEGSLSASLTGAYTADEAALFELEVVSPLGSTPLVSRPSFTGRGNGEMTDMGVTGLTPRVITVELADLGEILAYAYADLLNVKVRATAPGADGNKLSLQVERTNLVFTEQPITLLSAIQQGTKSITGPEFDWDTAIITGDEIVPADAHRVSFGENENNIYVQYKRWVDGEWAYFFEPAIKEHVYERTTVNFVTGSYTVKLYEDVAGTPTLRETYANVVTLYDLLNAIKTNSTYLTVEGVVANDRSPGGQALLELALRTDARYLQNSGFKEVEVFEGTPTELIEATCFAASADDDNRAGIGQERWEVRGSVSGLIRKDVSTDELIEGAYWKGKIKPKVALTIPHGKFEVASISYVSRTEEETTPPLCPVALTLGINAQVGTITLTWKARPTEEEEACPCDTLAVPDLSDAECLGLGTDEIEQGGLVVPTYTDQDTLDRVKTLYDWSADVVRDNSYYLSGTPRQDPFIATETINAIFKNFGDSLKSVVTLFERVLGWIDPLEAGAVKTAAYTAWDNALIELQADVADSLGLSSNPETFDAGENLSAGDAVMIVETEPGTRKVFKAQGYTDPLGKYGWVNAAVSEGDPADVYHQGANNNITTTETCEVAGFGVFWAMSVANPGQWVKVGDGVGGSATYSTLVTMNYTGATSGFVYSTPNPTGQALLRDRYATRLQSVLAEAELSPLGKFDASSAESGDTCWQDNDDEFYFEVSGPSGLYAPAFANTPYISARKRSDGAYYSTKEFGFQINVGCVDGLKEGDVITLEISGVASREGWAVGDKVQLGLLAAGNVLFQGGRDGENQQTWFVSDSEDGPLAPYFLDTDSPVPYSDGGIEFLITPGTLDFVKGDKFTFAVEQGQFRWRKDGGGWSANTDIVATPVLLSDGLSVQFTLGTTPAITPDDQFQFQALQPYAVSNAVVPDEDAWNWGDDVAMEAVFDLGSNKNINALAAVFHNLPNGVDILVEGGTAPGVYTWDETIEWAENVMGLLLSTAQVARYVRVTINGAAEKQIGWLFIGESISFTYSAQVQIKREYKMDRSTNSPAGLFRAAGVGSEVRWPEGHLLDADYTKLVDMVDWLKRNNDESLILFPQSTRPSEIVVAKLDSDNIVIDDVFNFQPNVGKNRKLSAQLPLKAVCF